MAKILLSVPGESIASRVDGTVFQQTRYGLCAQRLGLQRLTPSALQLRERSAFKTIANNWTILPSGTKAGYRDGAPPGFTGYMLYQQRAVPVYNANGVIVPAYTPAITPVPSTLQTFHVDADLPNNRYIFSLTYLLLPPPSIQPNVANCYYFIQRTAGVEAKLELASLADALTFQYSGIEADMTFAFNNAGPQGPMSAGDLVYFWVTAFNSAGGIQIVQTFSSNDTIPNP